MEGVAWIRLSIANIQAGSQAYANVTAWGLQEREEQSHSSFG